MKRLSYGIIVTFIALLLTGCGSTTYSYTDTTHELGYHQCYLEDTEIVMQPIINIGLTEEVIEYSAGETVYNYSDYMIDELSYNLYRLEDGNKQVVKQNITTPEFTEEQYLNQTNSSRLLEDYLDLLDDDFFDIGTLDSGEYELELMSVTSYINEESEDNERISKEEVTTYSFEVKPSCGEITTDVILLEDEVNETDLRELIEGTLEDGSFISAEDIVFYQDHVNLTGTNLINFKGGLISSIFTADFYTPYTYGGYYSIDFQSDDITEHVEYDDNFFYNGYIEGLNSEYIRFVYQEYLKDKENWEQDTHYDLVVNLRGTNIYKTILVLFEPDNETPVFDDLLEDQVITEGDSIDLLDLGLTATDNIDGDMTEHITVNIAETSTMSPGDYDVIYTVEDRFGNTATTSITLTIEAADTVAPTITVYNELETMFEVGSTLPDFTTYFTVNDDVDGVITVTEAMLSWDTEIDASTAGTYPLTLTVSDAAMNESTITLNIVIIDSDPVFDNVPAGIDIESGTSLDLLELGLTATDTVDGDLTDVITVNITDTSVLDEGDYTVIYTVTDSAGNEVTTSVILSVVTPPTTYTGDILSSSATSMSIVLMFDVDLFDVDGDPTLEADPFAFTITVDGVVATITQIYVGATSIEFELDQTLSENSTVLVTYNPTGLNDITYSDTLLDGFTDYNVDTSSFGGNTANDVFLEAIAFDAYTVDIYFDVTMLDQAFVDVAAFSVTIDGVEATITNAFVNMNMVSLFVVEEMLDTSNIEVSYLPTGNNDLTYDGVHVGAFDNEYVIPPTTSDPGSEEYTGEVLVATAYDASTIDITFDVDTFDLTFIDQTAFIVTIDGVEATITNDFVNINTVSLTISETMTDTSFIEVSYQPTGNSDLTYGGVVVPSFTNEVVIPPNSF